MTDFEHFRTATLARLRRTDLQVSLLMLVITFGSAALLPGWLAFVVIVICGFIYVRMHQEIMRREEELETFGQQPHEQSDGSRLVIRGRRIER